MVSPEQISDARHDINSRLLWWFEHHQREFPWRETSDAFHILLAEKLLQQTKARDLVIDIYTTLLQRYPSPEELAEANLATLSDIVKPLGLVYRAQELKSMASEIVKVYNHRIPSEFEQLMKLPGVGDYCARAVLSFSYKQRIAIVDTNVARWLHRMCGINQPIPANPARKKYLYDLANALLPDERVRDFNLAILDLCALVCKPKNPECFRCPAQPYCDYGRKAVLD